VEVDGTPEVLVAWSQSCDRGTIVGLCSRRYIVLMDPKVASAASSEIDRLGVCLEEETHTWGLLSLRDVVVVFVVLALFQDLLQHVNRTWALQNATNSRAGISIITNGPNMRGSNKAENELMKTE